MKSQTILNQARRIPNQAGISLLGALVAIFIAGALFTFAIATMPAYYDNYLIKNGMKSLYDPADPEALRMIKKSSAKGKLANFFTLNGVREVTVEYLEIDRRKDRTLINFNYEVRRNLFANVDLVMVFKNQLDSTKPEECCEQLIVPTKKKSDKK